MIAAGMRHIFKGNATALAAVLAGTLISLPAHAQQAPPASQPTAAPTATPDGCSSELVQDGCGTLTFADGSTYVGGFRGGLPDGSGRVAYADGSTFQGEFEEGDISGHNGIFTQADGTVMPGKFHDAGLDVSQPHIVTNFPFWRAFFGDSAVVFVAAVIKPDGSVTGARVITPNKDYPSFDEAALEGVKQWRYVPATVDGKPVETIRFIQLQFATVD